MKPGTKWILIVVGLLAFNVIAAVTLMVIANGHDRSQVLPSYKFEAK